MAEDERSVGRSSDQSVIELLRYYGSAMEALGRASTGSPRGMDASMRYAQGVAREVLFALIGREPSRNELSQVPPLYQDSPVQVPLGDLDGGDDSE